MSVITDQMILDSIRLSYFNLATSGAKSYTIYGRTFERYEMSAMLEQITFWESRIDAASQAGNGNGVVLANCGSGNRGSGGDCGQ